MSNEERKVPELRFKGFHDDWEQRKLGEVFKQTSNLVNPEAENLELWSLTVEHGLTPKTARYNRSFLVKKNDKFKAVDNNEFIYNPMNMTLGAVDLNSTGKTVAVSGYYITMISQSNFDSKYFNFWLKSTIAIKNYKIFATGSLIERQRVQFPTLSQIKTKVPSFSEQQRIGNMLMKLDNTITLHQRKINIQKEMKRIFLEKIFSIDEFSHPDVRFIGYTSKWDNSKIKNYLLERNERSSKGELISVTIDNGVRKTESLNRKNNSSDDKSNYKIVKQGDIPYNSMRMWQGASGLSRFNGILSPAYTVLIPNENASGLYFSYLFKSRYMLNQFQKYSQGLTSDTWNLKYPLLKDIKISAPELIEQQKIGNFFSEIDKNIHHHQKEVRTLNKLKELFLNKMFL